MAGRKTGSVGVVGWGGGLDDGDMVGGWEETSMAGSRSG